MSYIDFEEIIRGLLLNTSLVFLPLFIFESLVLDRKGYQSKKISPLELSLLTSISVILTMTFPVPLFDGHLFDFRMIPILVACFYGGKQAIFASVFTMFIYRIYLSGDGLYTMFVVYASLLVIAAYISPRYKKYTRNKKILVALYIITFLLVLMFLSTFIVNMNKDGFGIMSLVYFFIIYYISNIIALFLTINLMEGFIEKQELRTEILRADRLNSVAELAASLAHEIRNPLTAAKGFIQLRFLYPNLDIEKQKEYLETAINEIDRAESVIEDFLSLAKPYIEKEEVINVALLIESIVKVMSPYAMMENVDIVRDLAAGCYLYTDKNKLTQVLINIIKNGIEATSPRGKIHIKNLKDDKNIIIEISDTGKGMTKEEVSRLGTPFYSLKSKGTGLGLMISYRFIEVIGGRIRVNSEKGKGAKFIIRIPHGGKRTRKILNKSNNNGYN